MSSDGQGKTAQRVWLAARVLLLVGLLAALWYGIDWAQLASIATALPPYVILLIVMCGTGSRLFGVVRWNFLCGGLLERAPGVPRLLRLGLLAEFVNIWIPSFIGGEVVRIWGVSEHADTASATWSVAIDRLLGLAGLLLSLVPLAFLVELPIPAWAYAAGVGLVATGIATGFLLRPWLLQRGGWAAALAGLHPPRVLGALALSVCSPWCLVVGYLMFFSYLHPLPPGHVAAFILLSRFGRAVPIQLFGINSVEGTMWVLGEILGIPREILALALAMNFSDKLTHSMIGGALELASNGTEVLRKVMSAGPPG